VLPISLNAFGIALVFPILTLAILDMYPQQRGGASSLQAFTGLVSNALIAGVLSSLVSSSGMGLAVASSAFSIVAWLVWRHEQRDQQRMRTPSSAQVMGLEPTDEM
jgi:DHA1 family bicyclomycin/chloramphenicol resistance-like MFS transporter